jgi:ATP-dependent RNA helicase DeaD
MSEEVRPTFESIGLAENLVRTLEELGYESPTPIQEKTIPVLLKGRDLIGQAQTGTGKTAAFALPLLSRIDVNDPTTQALILTPTRELAMQVAEAIHNYSKHVGQVSTLPVYGGAPMYLQVKRLDRGAHIVVGTPGRLIDHLSRGTLKLDSLKMLVLDEADEMLKMGFQEDVERIISSSPDSRQTALFSATMPDGVRRIASQYLDNPVRIEIEHKSLAAPAIEQRLINLSEGQKLEVLTRILEIEEAEAVIVFRRTKTGAAELAEKLEARGFAAVAMHGDMSQSLRESVIRRVKAGQVEIVVATDVAARGLDVEQIRHVVNYDVPHDVEAYVHRIGRTGRAGRSGVATIFVTPRERRMLREIERFTGSPIKPMKMPTQADVNSRRIEAFKQSLRDSIEAGDLDLYVELVETIAEETGKDIAEVAAAAARLANSSAALGKTAADDHAVVEREAPRARPARASEAPKRPEREEQPGAAVLQGSVPEEESSNEWKPRRAAAAESSRPVATRANLARGEDESKVRLSIAVGKRDGIRPADIVGSIANEADIPGKDIGPIEIREEVTYVGLPSRYASRVIERTARAKFRGRPLNVQIARDGASETFDRARDAFERGTEKKNFRKRDEGFAARKTFRTDDELPRTRRDDDERPSTRKPARAPHSRAAGERFGVSRFQRSDAGPRESRFRSTADRPERAAPRADRDAGATRFKPRSSARPDDRFSGGNPKRRTFGSIERGPKERDAAASPSGSRPFPRAGSARPAPGRGPKKFGGPKSFGKGPKKRR